MVQLIVFVFFILLIVVIMINKIVLKESKPELRDESFDYWVKIAKKEEKKWLEK